MVISRLFLVISDSSAYVLPIYLNLIIGMPLFLFGGGLIIVALIKMRIYSLSGVNVDEPLNTNGIYKIVRHPIYFGEILWPIGLTIAMGRIFSIFIVIGLTLYFVAYARLEETKLVEIHGDIYKEYQKKVPMLFPLRVRRKSPN